MTSLQTIPLQTPYRIVSVEGDCCTAQRVRELGLVSGAVCTVVRRAAFGGPMEIALDRRTIALRLTSQLAILVEPLTMSADSVSLFDISPLPAATVPDESVAA